MDTVMEEIDKANAVQIEPMEGQLGKHVVVVVKRKGRPITGAKDSWRSIIYHFGPSMCPISSYHT
jgi:hypothetical protein